MKKRYDHELCLFLFFPFCPWSLLHHLPPHVNLSSAPKQALYKSFSLCSEELTILISTKKRKENKGKRMDSHQKLRAIRRKLVMTPKVKPTPPSSTASKGFLMDPSANHLQMKKKQLSVLQSSFDTETFYFTDAIYPDDAGVDAKATSYISYVQARFRLD